MYFVSMEEVCKELSLEMRPKCLDWLRQAADHCKKLLVESPHFNVWKFIKSLFISLPENDPVTAHATRIDRNGCRSLLQAVATNFIKIQDQYAADKKANMVLRRIIKSWFGFIILVAIMLIVFYINGKIKKRVKKDSLTERLYCSQDRTLLSTKQILYKDECQTRIEKFLSPGGGPIKVLIMRSKLELLEMITNNNMQANKSKTEIKRKLLNFLGENVRKAHSFIIFDDKDDPPSLSLIPIMAKNSQQTAVASSKRISLNKPLVSSSKSSIPVYIKRKRPTTRNK
uniref:Uncharacterized protein n=1 Tax=Glossina brevipalpis TaxID=37001 RepID=A0A1A9X388_9MUSC